MVEPTVTIKYTRKQADSMDQACKKCAFSGIDYNHDCCEPIELQKLSGDCGDNKYWVIENINWEGKDNG